MGNTFLDSRPQNGPLWGETFPKVALLIKGEAQPTTQRSWDSGARERDGPGHRSSGAARRARHLDRGTGAVAAKAARLPGTWSGSRFKENSIMSRKQEPLCDCIGTDAEDSFCYALHMKHTADKQEIDTKDIVKSASGNLQLSDFQLRRVDL